MQDNVTVFSLPLEKGSIQYISNVLDTAIRISKRNKEKYLKTDQPLIKLTIDFIFDHEARELEYEYPRLFGDEDEE